MILSLFTTLIGGAALAGGPTEFTGELRVSGAQLTEIPLDAEGTVSGGEPWIDQRFRLGLGGEAGRFGMAVEADLFTGIIYGEPYAAIDERSRQAASADGFRPRKALLTFSPDFGRFAVGLTTSHWGLGMLANDGDTDPWFGQNELGDRTLRASLTTGAFGQENLYFTVAADRVLADDIARWTEEQAAWQGVGSLYYATANTKAGVYGVYRYQREQAEDRTTRVGVADGFLDHTWEGPGVTWLRFQGEVAGILGSTDRATTYSSRETIAVMSGGATGSLQLISDEDQVWLVTTRAGWASGDADPDDGVSRDFTFDREFDVGMVLFDQVLGRVEGATYDLLSDPGNSGQPPDGVDAIATEGAFRRAAFVQPIVDVNPHQILLLRAGVSASWATAPHAQPFYTYRAGGTPTNHHNAVVDGRLLGTELNWLVSLHDFLHGTKNLSNIHPDLTVQGGHLLVGPALAGAGPDRIDLFLATGRLRW